MTVFSRSYRIALLAGVFTLGFAGCALEDLAKQAADNSGHAAKNSDTLLAASENGLLDGRAGGARDARRQELKLLTQNDQDILIAEKTTREKIVALVKQVQEGKPEVAAEIVKAEASLQSVLQKKLGGKVPNAAAFLQGFEFHLWKSAFSYDTPERRLSLFTRAVTEFFYSLGVIAETDLNNLAVQSKMNMQALAVALHTLHESQIDATRRYGNGPTVILARDSVKIELPTAVSMFDLIAAGLKARVAVEKGVAKMEDLPEFVSVVAENKAAAIELLNVRMNTLLGSAVKSMLPDEVGAKLILAKYLPKEMPLPQDFKWSPDFSKLDDVASLRATRVKLLGAAQSQMLLQGIGAPVVLSQELALLTKTITGVQEQIPAEPKTPRDRELVDLIKVMIKLQTQAAGITEAADQERWIEAMVTRLGDNGCRVTTECYVGATGCRIVGKDLTRVSSDGVGKDISRVGAVELSRHTGGAARVVGPGDLMRTTDGPGGLLREASDSSCENFGLLRTSGEWGRTTSGQGIDETDSNSRMHDPFGVIGPNPASHTDVERVISVDLIGSGIGG